MNPRTRRLLTSVRLSDAIDVPPFPVVQQFGIYTFQTEQGQPTAVTVTGIGRVYAKHFREWAGRPLPKQPEATNLQDLEPSPELMVAMLEAQNDNR